MGIIIGIIAFVVVIWLIGTFMSNDGILGSIANFLWYIWRKFWTILIIGIILVFVINILLGNDMF